MHFGPCLTHDPISVSRSVHSMFALNHTIYILFLHYLNLISSFAGAMASSSGTKPPRQPPIMSSWLRDLIYGVGVEVEVGIGSSVDVPPRPSVIARPPSEGSVYPQPYCLEEFLRKPILPPGTPIPPDPLDDPNNFIVLSVSCLPACYTSLVEQLGYKELLDFRVRLDNLDALGIRFGIHGIFVSGTNQPGCNDMSVYHSTPVAIEVVYALLVSNFMFVILRFIGCLLDKILSLVVKLVIV